MNDDMKQQLSSFMDGEIEGHADDAIDNLMASPELRDTWWRYHLISDVMKRELSGPFDNDMAGRIAEAIAGETVVYARNRFLSNRFFKPAAGFAIAATVAGIAILGIQHNSDRQPDQLTTPQVAEKAQNYNINFNRYTFPVSTETMPKDTVTARPEPVGSIEQNPQLNSYLVNYNEYRTSQNGVQGIIPYVRIIANDDDQ